MAKNLMNSKLTKFKATASATLVTLSLLSPITAGADIAQTPLFLSNSVDPNILFVLDDSGSMDWGLMTPENDGVMRIGGCTYYDSQPGPQTGNSDIPPTEADLLSRGIAAPYSGVWRAWNSEYNKLYYDPTVNYTPWPGLDGAGDAYVQADPTAAYYDPYDPDDGSRNLTAAFSYSSDFCAINGGTDFTVTGFFPARYYTWTDTDGDGDVDAGDVHVLIEIRPAVDSYTGSDERVDCAGAPNCTYAEEINNFANWFTYYRKREYVAKAAYGQVIAGAGNARMGLATLWDRGGANTQIEKMNADPTADEKGELLDALFRGYGSGGTPLRRSFNEAGKYLSCEDNNYFDDCPALPDDEGGECQQNFAVIMTDGFYNYSFSGIGNTDGDNDTVWDSENTGPYGDTHSNTLADIAMEYYETDISAAANEVKPAPGGIDDNTAQHVVTYSVAFGVNGTLTAMPANKTDPFTWPQPNTDQTKIDDLRHAAWNGRGEFLSARNPGELIDGLNSALLSIQNRVGSAAAVAFNTGSLSTSTQVYLSQFNSKSWDGNLLAYNLNASTGTVSSTAAWNAGKNLALRDLSSSPRTLLTYNGTDGIAFQWASLTDTQKDDLRTDSAGDSDTEASGMARHAYLRGARGCEASSTGTCSYTDGTDTFNTKNLRSRTGILGDIIHSGPVFVGSPEANWPDVAPFPGGAGTSYSAFQTANANRPGMVYVGANDGMLHGFAKADGAELIGYLPNSLFSDEELEGLHYLANQSYAHRFMVDLTPSVSDAYIKATPTGSASWRTVLVGGLRAGGKGVYALDITDPTGFSEADSAPSDTVLWEFSAADDDDLGYTFSRPSIVPLEGPSDTIRWAAVLGNGYDDDGDGKAKLFILFLEGGLDGVWTEGTDYIKITTDTGNGLSNPALIDSDGDGLADRAYAGDREGNMWAFDLSGSDTAQWGSAYLDGSDPLPLFTAEETQPITTTPVIVRNRGVPTSVGNQPNVMVIFGTGSYINTDDPETDDTQAVYGVWDGGIGELVEGDLQEQDISTGLTSEGVLGRELTDRSVNYADKEGWRIELPETGERHVTDPVIRGDLVFFNTTTPDADACSFGGTSWLMVADWLTGGRPSEVSFDLNRDGLLTDLDEIDDNAAAGEQITGIATSPVTLGDKRYTSTTESSGGDTIDVVDIIPGIGARTGRLSWEELTP